MARSRIISILVSAVVLTFVALVVVRGISAFEQRAFEAGRALLVAGAEHAELELSGGGEQLPAKAVALAGDGEVGTLVRALSQLISRAPPGSPASNRLKANISRTSKKLNERLTAMRSDTALDLQGGFDALTVASGSGEVLVTDSPHFRIGEVLAGTGAPNGGAEADPVEATAAADVLFAAVADGKSARSTLIVGKGAEKSVVWVGAAPILFKNRLYGVVILEEKLKSLPQPSGVSAMLLIDGEVRLGRAPENYNPAFLRDGGEPFLLRPREAPSLVPLIGEVPIQPFFIGEHGAGIWANAFEVPGAANAMGYVLTDVTPLFSELGGFQLMTLALMALAWLVHATMILLTGRQLLAGIEHISDFLGKVHQGTTTEIRLNERKLPGGLHRLVRLVNKTVERTGAGVAPIAAAPSIDDVFKAQGPKEDLAFEGIGNSGSLGVESPLDSPLPEPADDLGGVDDFDPFNATGEIGVKPAAVGAGAETIGDGYQELGNADGFVGGGVAPDPMAAGQNALPADWDAGDSLSAFDEVGETEIEPSLPNDVPLSDEASPAPAVGSAVADLFSSKNGGNVAAAAPDPGLVEPADPDIEAHYREVFDQFVAARESCGESTADLTFDRFIEKLQKSRAAVMSKHNCSEVHFSVYVKNGKAALKATPAR